jgi:hypothetical protein
MSKRILLPGNYWITKSMEFSKVNQSGTLWYLKKFILYYYYVFLTDFNEDKQSEMFNYALDFIDSLSFEVKDEAFKFFFSSENDCYNHVLGNKTRFVTYSQFIKDSSSENLNTAKKIYFAYLMTLGGQSGYKLEFKKFLMSHENLTFNSFIEFASNYYDKNSKSAKINSFNQMINDYHAALRNERQIFFYYGFIQGNESKDLKGFHKLTNIGKAVVYSTYSEILILWEHQKIKMVSQSPATKVNDISEISALSIKLIDDNLAISISPYYTMLYFLKKYGYLSLNDYQFVLSRLSSTEEIDLIDDLDKERISNEEKIKFYGRKADINSEDFSKELKKYFLGILKNKRDKGDNPFAVIEFHKSLYTIVNEEKFNDYFDLVKMHTNYLSEKHIKKFTIFRKSFKEAYKCDYQKKENNNHKDIYEWLNYIINFDELILLSLIGYVVKEDYLKELISIEDIKYRYRNLIDNFISNDYVNNHELFKIILFSDDLSKIPEIDTSPVYEDLDYSYETEEAIRRLIENLSDKNENPVKERNINLISKMRKLYNTHYLNKEGKYTCECCNYPTFKNKDDLWYMEFHHLIPFKIHNGPDHYLNIYGLCPSCHRRFHHINDTDEKNLYDNVDINNKFKITILNRAKILKSEGILEPIHLQFLLAKEAITKGDFKELWSTND